MEDYRARNMPAPHWYECVWSSEQLGVKSQPVYARTTFRINIFQDFNAQTIPQLPADAIILPVKEASFEKTQSIDALVNAGLASVPGTQGVVYVFPPKLLSAKKAL